MYAVGGAAICCGLSSAAAYLPTFFQISVNFDVCYNFYLFCFPKSQNKDITILKYPSLTYRAKAAKLGLSYGTVRNHLLGLHNGTPGGQ